MNVLLVVSRNLNGTGVKTGDAAQQNAQQNLRNILFHCCPVNFFEKQVNYMNLN